MRKKRKESMARTFIGFIAIVIGIIVCTTTIIIATDVYCRADIDHWMPIYPNAQFVRTEATGFFRERASGITRQIYYTSDTPGIVRRWYSDYRLEITSGQFNSSNPNAAMSGIARANYQVLDDPDSEGSLLIYYSECAYN